MERKIFQKWIQQEIDNLSVLLEIALHLLINERR